MAVESINRLDVLLAYATFSISGGTPALISGGSFTWKDAGGNTLPWSASWQGEAGQQPSVQSLLVSMQGWRINLTDASNGLKIGHSDPTTDCMWNIVPDQMPFPPVYEGRSLFSRLQFLSTSGTAAGIIEVYG